MTHARRLYGLIGAGVIMFMLIGSVQDLSWTGVWITPIAWYGYILFVDWLIDRQNGNSFLIHHTREFGWMAFFSVGLWSVFELHNLLFHNWIYSGLPENIFITGLGFIVAFSSILPAMYVTHLLVRTCFVKSIPITPQRYSKLRLLCEICLGLICICAATFYPSPYTGPLIWPGYLFVFSPLNHLVGLPSIFRERQRGNYAETVSLLAGGFICGFFWEFFNYFAGARWSYNVPYLPHIRIFEMPVVGFLGFGPFAVLFFEMYRFVRNVPHVFNNDRMQNIQ